MAAGQGVALHIESTRAPFVVRRGQTTEVPWLDGSSGVGAAGRMELIKRNCMKLHD